MAEDVPTVLVTGASGYIATHIVQQLLQNDEYKVRGTVRSAKNEAKVAALKNLCPDPKYPLELVEADLSDEAPWLDAIKVCTYVLHTASPFPAERPKHEDEVIKPAVDGTLHVLRACKAAGGVKRVVLTSSSAAVFGGFAEERKFSEKDWPDLSKPMDAYAKSKTLAEKAAWDFMNELPDDEKFELVVINPTYVIGPVLCEGFTTSQQAPKRMLERSMPMVPKIHFPVVDVRDVARAHINAMTVPEAAGNRHLLAPDEGWFKDMAKVLDEEFGPQGYKVPTREAPNFIIRLNGLFDGTVRMICPGLGKRSEIDSDRMEKVLGITNPIKMKQSLVDMAYSMIEAGKIKKTSGYKGHPKAN